LAGTFNPVDPCNPQQEGFDGRGLGETVMPILLWLLEIPIPLIIFILLLR
jgi:hypothetical protein